MAEQIILTDKNPAGPVRYVSKSVSPAIWALFSGQAPMSVDFWAAPVGPADASGNVAARIFAVPRGGAAPAPNAAPIVAWIAKEAETGAMIAIANLAGNTLETVGNPVDTSKPSLLADISMGQIALLSGMNPQTLAGASVAGKTAMLFGYEPVLDGSRPVEPGPLVQPAKVETSVTPYVIGALAVLGVAAYLSSQKKPGSVRALANKRRRSRRQK